MAAEDLGTDFGGGRDLDPSLRMVSGHRALADAIIRRLTTDKGALRDYPSYGFNIENLIGSTLNESAIRQGVINQVYAEEEVESAIVTVRFLSETIYIDIVVQAGAPPFTLTLSVDAVGVESIIPADL